MCSEVNISVKAGCSRFFYNLILSRTLRRPRNTILLFLERFATTYMISFINGSLKTSNILIFSEIHYKHVLKVQAVRETILNQEYFYTERFYFEQHPELMKLALNCYPV